MTDKSVCAHMTSYSSGSLAALHTMRFKCISLAGHGGEMVGFRTYFPCACGRGASVAKRDHNIYMYMYIGETDGAGDHLMREAKCL